MRFSRNVSYRHKLGSSCPGGIASLLIFFLLEEPPGSDKDSPDFKLLSESLGQEVRSAVDALPAVFRSVIWLADVEGLSYREISEILDCPMGTVASRLYRGHSLLREQLAEYAQRRGLVQE